MTNKQFADVLTRHGLINSQAVDDPEGYDNYETLENVNAAAEELRELNDTTFQDLMDANQANYDLRQQLDAANARCARMEAQLRGCLSDAYALNDGHEWQITRAIKLRIQDANSTALADLLKPTIELLREGADTARAAQAEVGISAMRFEYRVDLEKRLRSELARLESLTP